MEGLERMFYCLLFFVSLSLQLIASLLYLQEMLWAKKKDSQGEEDFISLDLLPINEAPERGIAHLLLLGALFLQQKIAHAPSFTTGWDEPLWVDSGFSLIRAFSLSHVKILKKDFILWNVFNLKANILIAESEKTKDSAPIPPQKKTKSKMQIPLK